MIRTSVLLLMLSSSILSAFYNNCISIEINLYFCMFGALDRYDQMLFEDETKNRMMETKELFDWVLKQRCFEVCIIIITTSVLILSFYH
jgi:hypothetical protein